VEEHEAVGLVLRALDQLLHDAELGQLRGEGLELLDLFDPLPEVPHAGAEGARRGLLRRRGPRPRLEG
jgi:hypothetical protein